MFYRFCNCNISAFAFGIFFWYLRMLLAVFGCKLCDATVRPCARAVRSAFPPHLALFRTAILQQWRCKNSSNFCGEGVCSCDCLCVCVCVWFYCSKIVRNLYTFYCYHVFCCVVTFFSSTKYAVVGFVLFLVVL